MTIPPLQTASKTRRFVHDGQTWSLEALGTADAPLDAALDFVERLIQTSEQPMAGLLQVHGSLVRFGTTEPPAWIVKDGTLDDDALNGRR